MRVQISLAAAMALAAMAVTTTPSLSKSCGTKCLQGKIEELTKKVDNLTAALAHTQIRESDNHNICLAHNTPGQGFGTKDCAGGSDEFFVIGSH
ncbi:MULTISPECIES: hypothetical protein [Mesorhizobium]|uniref:hypothetical protein n=1 Tax=Mesorhizobium TaxID=68287 RepID=UPI0010A974F1|nr:MULTISPECIES: hypothetical protein [Mesorhizobium]